MGNAVPLRMCRDEAATAAVASVGRRRRPKNVVTDTDGAARRSAAVMPLNKQRDEDEGTTRAGRRCAGAAVSWAGGAGDDAAAAAGKAPGATVATVKIVLRRKDAEALVARLNAQSAWERKARMAEIKVELRAGECCGGASPASCRDAWRPRLAPIKEN